VKKNIRITAIIILALLFYAVVGTLRVNLGRANGLPGINPKISILTLQNATYREKTITINCSVAYNWEGSCSLVYSLDGQKRGSPTYQAVTSRGDGNPGKNPRVIRTTMEGRAVLSNLAEGWHTVTFDLVANREVVYSASTKFKIDSIAPEVSILSPLNKTYDSNIPMNFTVNEFVSLGSIEYSLGTGENITLAGNTTLTGLRVGEYTITVFATDEAGNTGASETVIFTIEEPHEPFPTTMVIAPIASVAAIGLGLLFYFKKRQH
jgi:hypothetical protein